MNEFWLKALEALKIILIFLPFLLLVFFSSKTNLSHRDRSRHVFMPLVALVFCIVAGILLGKLTSLIIDFFNSISGWIVAIADKLMGVGDGALQSLCHMLYKAAEWLANFLLTKNVALWAEIILNSLIIIAYLPLKSVFLSLMSRLLKDGSPIFEIPAGLVYYKDERKNCRYVRDHIAQGITLMKTLYISTIILAFIGVVVTAFLFRMQMIASLYYPVFSVILVGEIYYFLDGVIYVKEETSLEGEADNSDTVCDYSLMRNVLRRSFGDKLLSENTSINSGLAVFRSNDELLNEIEDGDGFGEEAYSRFMRFKASRGLEIDQNYLMSGLELLRGKSILFNNPFYYDLVPYIFYPMNRAILRRKKVLIVLGRHSIEEDIETWCRAGLSAVTHIPSLWNIEVLNNEIKDPDVGIITRSCVHDLKMHEANSAFFKEVEFVVLIEPSRLVATAQIGLNSLVRHCKRDGKNIVFVSTDKNCDGCVDALSHILMTSLEEVSATNKHKGVSSYMCWEVDDEHLQHRMLPNLSRYLGTGTELSFTALKNQVSRASWYGGDAFPVQDMHWIVKQYYYDLMHYASLPELQTMVDEVFVTSANMWEAKALKRNYITVEDESYNMFEVKREFSTRATEQGFINVISTDYLLKDYMAANDSIFNADSKAIPYIVADYARTERNVIYRLCLRLSISPMLEGEIKKELALINLDTGNVHQSLWSSILKCTKGVASDASDGILRLTKDGKEYAFNSSVITERRKYSLETGNMETVYVIKDKLFISVLIGDLCSAEYIAEDESGKTMYLGSELSGHVFQKYLPGQFFTFGGKYYEMLSLSSDGKVIVRRAADHINGRPQYRQIRNYYLENAVDSDKMGDIRDTGKLRITKQFADITVETPAYWSLRRYNDFETGKRTEINGVPCRSYLNKQILKIDFKEAASQKVLDTLALLINEVFRTLYAENQNMIVAVTPGSHEAPLTYSLSGKNGFEPSSNSIYIIEDSQLDIGFLISVERNLDRILTIVCDYLSWHTESLEESLTPPPEPEKPDYTVQEEDAPKKKRGFFGAIGDFFKKIFKRKKKKDKKAPVDETPETPIDDAPVAEAPVEEAPVAEAPVAEAPVEEITPVEETPIEETEEAPTEDDSIEEPVAEEAPKKKKGGFFRNLFKRKKKKAAEEAPIEEAPADEAPEEEAPVEEIEETSEETVNTPLLSRAPVKRLYSEQATDLEFEGDGATQVAKEFKRLPYKDRYYLLYGGTEIPQSLDTAGTLELLVALGFGGSNLEQARKGKDEAEIIEKSFVPDKAGSHYCDFCGVELMGMEYEVLSDGRERCISCSRTAVKNEKEFRRIYEDVTRNMLVFYGVNITEPIQIKMVNAKKLHKRLGKSFVPTGKSDGRILGVAIKDKDGYSIYLENGSPRLSATMTMVHELTHIWQYLNWDAKQILDLYGKEQNLEIYEGMAKWSEIQYAYLIGESATAKREEIITRMRDDEYGHGFNKYLSVYPLSIGTTLKGATPFADTKKPL